MQHLQPHHHRLIGLRLDGHTYAEIAEKNKISPNTVQYHFQQIYEMLGINSFIELPRAYANYRAERGLQPNSILAACFEK